MKISYTLQTVKFYGDHLTDAKKVVILLHGRRQNVDDAYYQFGKPIGTKHISFAAPIADNNTWYPHGFMVQLEQNQPYLDISLNKINTLINSLKQQQINTQNIVFMGFSQGACLAAEYVRSYPDNWGGLIMFTGGLFGPEGTSWQFSQKFANMPTFIGTSDRDEWIPLKRAQDTAKALSKAGANVDFRVYAGMDHVVNEDEINSARTILFT